MAIGKLTAAVLDTPDPQALAAFYEQLLGWTRGENSPDWVTLRPPDGGAGLSFQGDVDYVRPTWPATPGEQQMMSHLDVEVHDLTAAVAAVTAIGAVVAEFQPQDTVRVCLDPAGHPFCLFVNA